LGLPRVLVRNAVFGLVVSVIACATLIPRLGAVGAAAATAIAILAFNGLASSFLWHRMNFVPWDRPLVLTVAAFVAGTAAAVLLSRLVTNDFGRLAISAALGGIPTLAVSVLAGGVADREILAAALTTVRRGKGRPMTEGHLLAADSPAGTNCGPGSLRGPPSSSPDESILGGT
jgi:O-antigen/teichoic acid export membrane protein